MLKYVKIAIIEGKKKNLTIPGDSKQYCIYSILLTMEFKSTLTAFFNKNSSTSVI